MSGSLVFPRCSKPSNALDKGPKLVTLCDGALPAFAAAVYIVWETVCEHYSTQCDGDFIARPLTAKSRVTPLSGLSIPRSECNAVVLGSRLTLSAARALSVENSMSPSSAVLLADSECVISTLDKNSSPLKPYFLNRTAEIIENLSELRKICPVEEIHYVPGSLNVADLGTRPGIKLADLDPDSIWQQGPKFLCLRRDLWPVSRDFVRTPLADEEVKSKQVAICASMSLTVTSDTSLKLCLIIQSLLHYSNSLNRVIRGWKEGMNLTVIQTTPNAQELQNAEQIIMLSAMLETYQAVKKDLLSSLLPQRDGALIVTCGRIGEDQLSGLLGKSNLPILMPQTRAVFLI